MRALVARDVGRLYDGAGSGVGPEEMAARWDGLPEPVRRYLCFAVSPGVPRLRTVRVRHEGLFRTSPDAKWLRITGEEHFAVSPPGFVWNARVRPAPLVWIEARDLLLDGRGHMLVKLLSLFTLADERGAHIDQGSHLRWLGEAVWFPLAFAGPLIRWERVDDTRALVSLAQEGLPVEMFVDVDAGGRVTQVGAERYRDLAGGRSELTPWRVRCGEYRDFGGLSVPAMAEVSWLLDTGEFTYARFQVTALEYNVRAPWGSGTSLSDLD
jgi:hypothetical protein